MDSLSIEGGNRLDGGIVISGAKNAALPLMAATLMAETPMALENLPELADTVSMLDLLNHLGVATERQGGEVRFSPASPPGTTAPYDIVRRMRASVLVLGPLLARHRKAKVSLPGGCAIGTRPVDLHIMAMKALGAEVDIVEGYIEASAPSGLAGAEIKFPTVSVGATENTLMAAALAKGETRMLNAAREPEITDLAECLIAMGASIEGQGTPAITVTGVESLNGCRHPVIADRIETGTFAIATAMAGGTVTLENCRPDHLDALWSSMGSAGIKVEAGRDKVTVSREGGIGPVDVTTEPYPGFPTDLQAQFMAMMCLAEGQSTIAETIFENRFMHVPELGRMGARVDISGSNATIHGPAELIGAQVMATDLRASVSLVLAGLVADGVTTINRVYHLDRGYFGLEAKLRGCGAVIRRLKEGGRSDAGA